MVTRDDRAPRFRSADPHAHIIKHTGSRARPCTKAEPRKKKDGGRAQAYQSRTSPSLALYRGLAPQSEAALESPASAMQTAPPPAVAASAPPASAPGAATNPPAALHKETVQKSRGSPGAEPAAYTQHSPDGGRDGGAPADPSGAAQAGAVHSAAAAAHDEPPVKRARTSLTTSVDTTEYVAEDNVGQAPHPFAAPPDLQAALAVSAVLSAGSARRTPTANSPAPPADVPGATTSAASLALALAQPAPPGTGLPYTALPNSSQSPIPVFKLTNPDVSNTCAFCKANLTSGCWRRGWELPPLPGFSSLSVQRYANLCNKCGLRFKHGRLGVPAYSKQPRVPSVHTPLPPHPFAPHNHTTNTLPHTTIPHHPSLAPYNTTPDPAAASLAMSYLEALSAAGGLTLPAHLTAGLPPPAIPPTNGATNPTAPTARRKSSNVGVGVRAASPGGSGAQDREPGGVVGTEAAGGGHMPPLPPQAPTVRSASPQRRTSSGMRKVLPPGLSLTGFALPPMPPADHNVVDPTTAAAAMHAGLGVSDVVRTLTDTSAATGLHGSPTTSQESMPAWLLAHLQQHGVRPPAPVAPANPPQHPHTHANRPLSADSTETPTDAMLGPAGVPVNGGGSGGVGGTAARRSVTSSGEQARDMGDLSWPGIPHGKVVQPRYTAPASVTERHFSAGYWAYEHTPAATATAAAAHTSAAADVVSMEVPPPRPLDLGGSAAAAATPAAAAAAAVVAAGAQVVGAMQKVAGVGLVAPNTRVYREGSLAQAAAALLAFKEEQEGAAGKDKAAVPATPSTALPNTPPPTPETPGTAINLPTEARGAAGAVRSAEAGQQQQVATGAVADLAAVQAAASVPTRSMAPASLVTRVLGSLPPSSTTTAATGSQPPPPLPLAASAAATGAAGPAVGTRVTYSHGPAGIGGSGVGALGGGAMRAPRTLSSRPSSMRVQPPWGWTPEEMGQWLGSIGCGAMEAALAEQQVDGTALVIMAAQAPDLGALATLLSKEFPACPLGARLRLCAALMHFKSILPASQRA